MTPVIPLTIGLPEIALVALATFIIFAILGPRLLRDMRARFRSSEPEKGK